MIAYHGATIAEAERLADMLRSGALNKTRGFYVTNTPELAARYANARATKTVDPDATTLGTHGAIVTVEIPDDTRWTIRDISHNTLDVAEAWVREARVIHVEKKTCDYLFCSCHGNRSEYSAPQAAERIGLSEQRIRKLCSQSRIGRRIGNRWVIGHEELMALARSLGNDPRSPLH